MRTTLSAAAFREMFASESGEVFLVCLTLQHPNWPSNLTVVYNNQSITKPDPLTLQAAVYTPALFEVTLPEESPDKIPQVTLTIDNIDRHITDLVRTIPAPRVRVVMEVVLSSTPNYVEAGPFNLWLLQCSFDAQKVSGVLGLEDDIINAAFPSMMYTPSNSRGLFR